MNDTCSVFDMFVEASNLTNVELITDTASTLLHPLYYAENDAEVYLIVSVMPVQPHHCARFWPRVASRDLVPYPGKR